ncbi:MAG TPA: helix-turn-helix transcriptional regulator [Myxococcales bacterium]|jgi:transcriptional regulator with XRE-family HTH domain|nr:helix-turn-helix transcriptional regulator [Myxococcales bacterium]
MPARAPPTDRYTEARLVALGRRIRARREGLGVTAVAAAEAAGMSRVTLHRIERGEPSVTVGAYMSVVAALGLDVELREAVRGVASEAAAKLPTKIRLADYPELRRIAWQRRRVDTIAPKEALALYERNWRHVDRAAMDARERELVHLLVDALGGGRLLV